MRDAFIERIMEIAAREPRIFLITADLGFGVVTKFQQRFPRQYLNAGVAEQNMTGIATGLAMDGRIVYTYSIGNFPTLRCLEQIRNDACYHRANVKIVAIGGGFSYGALGMSHHATEDLAILRAIPEMTVISPCDSWEAAEATEAIATNPGVCYVRLDKSGAPPTSENHTGFHLGKATLRRQGDDLTLMSTGGILGEVLEAADSLAQEGIHCRVLGVHTIKPIDVGAIVDACMRTGGIVSVEEHTVDGGLGSAIGEVCMDEGIHPKKFLRLGLRGGYSSIVGSQAFLRKKHGLDTVGIAAAVRRLVSERPPSGDGQPVPSGGTGE